MKLDRLQAFLITLTRRSDIALAVLIVAIIFMIILPLPTTLVDFLIAISMTVGIVLLMVAVYIATPLSFSVFPAVLLVTTLFRLALAISTTRLILLQADAGKIIFAFGNFVVAGNFAVGAVIFLIITIVNFLVITKGAERVAEVSARFSLDAMPGKQMSIDGDMRAGVIDMEEARRRRENVAKESQLYGSMDGAMKFVKGDAIAGLVIAVINIIGGISIGTLQRGMSVGEAVQTYSILTIGDGLVQQIPALLISITAGIIVTRVTTEESTNLGADISRQVLAQPKALMIGGSLMFAFAFVPGFPTTVFVILAIGLMGIGYLLTQMEKKGMDTMDEIVPAMAPAGQSPGKVAKQRIGKTDEFSMTVPLLMDVSQNLDTTIKANELNDSLIDVRRALYLDLGVPFPGIHLRFNGNLPEDSYHILIEETPMASGFLRPEYVLCREDPNNLDMLGISYESGEPFLPGIDTIWVAKEGAEAMDKAGIDYLDTSRILTLHLSFVLKKYAKEFLGIQETRYLLSQMEADFAELVKEVQRVLPIQKITEILERLVSEEISIRNLRAILESLVEWGQKEKDTILLCEYVRGSLKRYISYKYSSGQNILPAYLLTEDAAETIRGGIRQTSAGSYLTLDPETTQHFVTTIKESVGDLARARSKPVMIVEMDIRRYVRKLIELELYELPVLSYQELTQEITIQPMDRISL